MRFIKISIQSFKYINVIAYGVFLHMGYFIILFVLQCTHFNLLLVPLLADPKDHFRGYLQYISVLQIEFLKFWKVCKTE